MYYASLTEWDNRRIDPVLMAKLDGTTIEAEGGHSGHTAVLVRRAQHSGAEGEGDGGDDGFILLMPRPLRMSAAVWQLGRTGTGTRHKTSLLMLDLRMFLRRTGMHQRLLGHRGCRCILR